MQLQSSLQNEQFISIPSFPGLSHVISELSFHNPLRRNEDEKYEYSHR
jgi:hypothetical protein